MGLASTRINGSSTRGRMPAVFSSISNRNGRLMTSSGFIAIAPGRSKWTSEYRQRVLPQPGQYRPVSAYSGQLGNGLPAT